jgi:toxin ParE1/3/4
MYTIQFSPLAKEDLMKIKVYLEEEFDVKIASEKIKQLLISIKRFEAFPLMGRPLMNVIDIPTDYMYFVREKLCVLSFGTRNSKDYPHHRYKTKLYRYSVW